MKNKYLLLITCYLLLNLSSCSIKLPDIKITGEKTALENQILGDYKRIKEDIWLIASERSDGKLIIPVDNSKVLEAVRVRMFYQDDLAEFKVKGILGEALTGYVEIMNNGYFSELGNNEKLLVRELLEKENSSRKIILERIMELNPSLDRYKKAEIGKAFQKLMLSESPDDTFFQDEERKWDRK